ncbi:MAG: hypothetical protein RLZZ275_280, partial [Bacteroidota bacterium]
LKAGEQVAKEKSSKQHLLTFPDGMDRIPVESEWNLEDTVRVHRATFYRMR